MWQLHLLHFSQFELNQQLKLRTSFSTTVLPAEEQARKRALAMSQLLYQLWRVLMVGNGTRFSCVAILAHLKDRSPEIREFLAFSDVLKKTQRINQSAKIRQHNLHQGEASLDLYWADGEKVRTGLSEHLCFRSRGSSRKCPKQTHCHNNRQSAWPSGCSSWCIWKSN